jgi:predicted nucleic acid-binding protein
MNPDFNYFIDTNVLVYYTFDDFEPEKHSKSFDLIQKLAESGAKFFISPQIVREYFAVVTNPRYLSNHLSPKAAIQEIRAFLADFELLNTDYASMEFLFLLLEKYNIIKQDVHDANIVVTMLENGIQQIITFNKDHFEKIKEIKVIVP